MDQQEPIRYELVLRDIRKKRKKERTDRAQPKALAEQDAKAKRHLKKINRAKAVIFKGRPLAQRARKKRIIKIDTGIKQSQADIDYSRYVGKLNSIL